MAQELGQQFLDAAASRLQKVTPRRVRVRAWTAVGSSPSVLPGLALSEGDSSPRHW